MVRRIQDATACSVLIGCSGAGIIGQGIEAENGASLSLMVMSLPGVRMFPVYLNQETLQSLNTAEDWQRIVGGEPNEINGWFAFVDPYRLDSETFVNGLADAFPDQPIIGGLASGDPRSQRTHVFLNGSVHDEGAVALGIGGDYTVRTVVSQGAEPIGEPWTITGVNRHVVQTIGQRPALEVLTDTIKGLGEDMQQRAQRNLLVGLVMDEYRDEFHRGDFLIRNLVGADPDPDQSPSALTHRSARQSSFNFAMRAPRMMSSKICWFARAKALAGLHHWQRFCAHATVGARDCLASRITMRPCCARSSAWTTSQGSFVTARSVPSVARPTSTGSPRLSD